MIAESEANQKLEGNAMKENDSQNPSASHQIRESREREERESERGRERGGGRDSRRKRRNKFAIKGKKWYFRYGMAQ
jgi:hypothetical protein